MDTTAALKIQKTGSNKPLPGLHFQTLEARLALLLEKGALPLPRQSATDSESLMPVPAIAFQALRGVS